MGSSCLPLAYLPGVVTKVPIPESSEPMGPMSSSGYTTCPSAVNAGNRNTTNAPADHLNAKTIPCGPCSS